MAKKDAARNSLRVLKRPRPFQRREPLPWNSPKSTEEDPEAHTRIEAILNSASYRRADTDFDFLARETFLADEGVIAREDRELFWFAETAEEIWNGIQAWHASGGPA